MTQFEAMRQSQWPGSKDYHESQNQTQPELVLDKPGIDQYHFSNNSTHLPYHDRQAAPNRIPEQQQPQRQEQYTIAYPKSLNDAEADHQPSANADSLSAWLNNPDSTTGPFVDFPPELMMHGEGFEELITWE